MADAKITALTADTTPTNDDLIVTVTDPGGTPANRKVTLADLTKAQIPQAAIASIPSAGWTGSVFFPTNAPLIGRDDGSAWDYYAPLWPIVDPTAKSWTDVNTPTVTNTGPFKNAYKASNGGNWSLSGQYYTAPSTPYTVTLGFFCQFEMLAAFQSFHGVGWRESATGKYVLFLIQENSSQSATARYIKFTDKDSFSAAYDASPYRNPGSGGPHWVQLINDGTNLSVKYSRDGINFILVEAARAKNDFFTTGPDGIFYGMVPYSQIASTTLFHLNEA